MHWPDALFHWFAASPIRYWVTAWTLFGLTAGLALLPESGSSRVWVRRLAHPAWFALAVLLTFLAFRWPTWFADEQVNPDEAHMIAGAITLREYPVFWRDVDGTTHGPLDDYILLLAPALGLPMDFAGARLVGTLLQVATLLAVWIAAGRIFDSGSARLAILPALLLWAATSFYDLLQYSSESMPICLAALGGAVGTVALTTSSLIGRRLGLFGAAVLLGLVPYAKLQGILQAGCIGLVLVALVWRSSSGNERGWQMDLGCLVVGALLPTLLLLAALAGVDLIGEFYQSYWRNNVLYANARHLSYADQLHGFIDYLDATPGVLAFCRGTLLAALLLLVPAMRGSRRDALALGWLIALVGFLSVIVPGRTYLHYQHFLIAPAAFLLAASLHAARSGFGRLSPWVARGAAVAAAVIATWPQISYRRSQYNPLPERYAGPQAAGRSEIGRLLLTKLAPKDRLSVWGWRPGLYVETGLPQGTRDGQTSRMIEQSPMREYYRRRYLADLMRNQPRWFVDATGGDNFAYKNRGLEGHQTYSDLATWVKENYESAGEADGCQLYELRRRR
ncbi:MAG TPA: hypothetical protein VF388_04315 [Lacunisphaera sp.]